MLEIFQANMMSPAVLFFVLGLIAAFVRSDLKFPKGLSETLSIYLLVAIGLKGGIELSKYDLGVLVAPIWAGILIGCTIPVVTIWVLRRLKVDRYHAAALAAAYGSVSIVTFGAAVDFLEKTGQPYEGYMSAVVAIMEIPALVISLMLLKVMKRSDEPAAPAGAGLEHAPGSRSTLYSGLFPLSIRGLDMGIIKESLSGKSILLLFGSLLIGLISGQEAMPVVQPLFIDLYRGFLLLFLLNMGMVCAEQFHHLRKSSYALLGFSIVAPIIYGTFGLWVGKVAGLSEGSGILLGVLAASASYIAAPAALKSAVPEASPSVYLGLALGVTFPLNLGIGIPYYIWMAGVLY